MDRCAKIVPDSCGNENRASSKEFYYYLGIILSTSKRTSYLGSGCDLAERRRDLDLFLPVGASGRQLGT